jgi:hypothetical protein
MPRRPLAQLLPTGFLPLFASRRRSHKRRGAEQGDGGAGSRGRHLLLYPFLAPMPPCGGRALAASRGHAATTVQEPAPRTTMPSSLSSCVCPRPLKRKEGEGSDGD